MRTIRPIKDRLLVRQDAPKEKLNNGLYLPQGSRELYDDVGVVVSKGPDCKEGYEVGDRIRFTRRPASHLGDVSEEWKDLLMLRDEDVVGIITDDV